jgi:glycosyltransferase 2 family protein
VRRWWRRLGGAALIAATAYWLGRLIARNWVELQRFEWRVDPPLVAASIAALVGVLALGVWAWGRTLRCFEHPPVRTRQLQRIWFLSNLARYVPGKIFQFVAVAQLSRVAGLSGAVLLTSMLVHTGMALLGALIVAAWTLAGGIVPPGWGVPVAALATLFAATAVHPRFLNALLGVVPRLLKRETISWRAGWRDGMALLGLSVINWMLYGVAYHLLLAAIADVPWALLPQMTGVNALSFLIGYASPLPGGAGLRELAMTHLLLPYLPEGVSAVLAIAARLWSVAGELAGAAAVVVLVRRR